MLLVDGRPAVVSRCWWPGACLGVLIAAAASLPSIWAAGLDGDGVGALIHRDPAHPGFIVLGVARVLRVMSTGSTARLAVDRATEPAAWVAIDGGRSALVSVHRIWVRCAAIDAIDEDTSDIPLGNPFPAPTFAEARPGALALPISRGCIVSVGTGRIFTGVMTDGQDRAIDADVLRRLGARMGCPEVRDVLDLIGAATARGPGGAP
jgi:hypothetical protein